MKNRIVSLIAAMVIALSTSGASVETDRTWYLAGESMKVSVTADDALIAYAELCDTHGMAAGVIIGLKENQGTGIIELPSDLHSGYYVLSVYTRHNPDVSQRLVAVVNPLRKSNDDDIEWVEVAHPDSLSYLPPLTPHLFSLTSSHPVDARETEGLIIKARVKNIYNGETFDSSLICPSLSIVGKQIHYFEGKMVNDSTAVFHTYGIRGRQPLVLSAMSSTGVSLPIEMISPFAILLPKQLPHLVFHYKRSEVETRSLDMQRHQRAIAPAKHELKIGELNDNTAVEGVPLVYDEKVFGIKPDLTYNLDEYRQFLTIREVLLEYVIYVSKKKVNGASRLFVRKDEEHLKTFWPSLVLIDGMPVIDVERLLSYDARRIHHINIYGGQFIFGNGIYNGILSFITRSGRLTNYPIERNVQYLVFDFPE